MDRIFFTAMLALALLFSCTEYERDNPYDPKGVKYDPSLVAGAGNSSPSGQTNPSSSGQTNSSSSEQTNSSSSGPAECGGSIYNPDGSKFCYGDKLYDKCDGLIYDPPTQICKDNEVVVAKCNGIAYNPITQFCQAGSNAVKDFCGTKEYTASQFCDTRDNNIYKWTNIGSQIWMAENLNYDVPGNDNDICYQNTTNNCNTYGRLYDFEMAMKVCPSGWHLPSDDEWKVLETFVGIEDAGTKLKAKTGWSTNGGIVGSDNFGFSALPGGYYASNAFMHINDSGRWWTSDTIYEVYAYAWYIFFSSPRLTQDYYYKVSLLSVRCVKD